MCGEPLDEALFLCQHRLLTGIGRFAIRLADRTFALVEIVIARVGRDLPAVDLRDLRHDAVHELAVVRGHQERAGQRLQELFEPDDRFDVQMVRRLVHQQDVGATEQDPRHGDAHLPAARKGSDVSVDALIVEAEAVQDLARLRFEGVAAKMLVLLLHVAEALEDAVHVVRATGSAIAAFSSSSS